MDKLDFEIIEKLLENSRLSFREIAKDLGVSTDTVMRRFNSLKKTETIKPTIRINLSKLGYQAMTWYLISLKSQTDVSSTIDQIAKIPDVIFVIKIVGAYDLLAIAFEKDFNQMHEVGEDLSKIDGVTKIEGRPFIFCVNPEKCKAGARGFYKA